MDRAVRKPRFGDIENIGAGGRWADDMDALRDLLGGIMMPLQQAEPGAIVERCGDCHVPLHQGSELHYERVLKKGRTGWMTVRKYRAHRCTALDPIALPVPFLT